MTILLAGAALPLLSGCGASEIVSPGSGGNITINNPTVTPTPTPTPTPTGTVTAADRCPDIADPQGLLDVGELSTPTGTWRVCTLPSRINVSSTLPKVSGVLYQLNGRVDVGTDGGATPSSSDSNVTLNINPGVIVFSGTGTSWLAVNRGNKINAVGTASEPIIFTSKQNVLGQNNINSSGQWGGIVLLGRAPVTDCLAPSATPGTTACERQTEGAADPARFGGATVDDNSGRISYVQIRYSGFVLENNSELQSLTPSGIGSATVLDHIMSYNSSDDGAEFFGGRVNMKYFVSVGAEDDNLDTDTGVQGKFQYVLAIQRAGGSIGDAMIEADSDNGNEAQTPEQNTMLANFTFIERVSTSSDKAAMLIRGNATYRLMNGVVSSPNLPCLRLSSPLTPTSTPAHAKTAVTFNSVQMQCKADTPYVAGTNFTVAEVQAAFEAGTNVSAAFTTTLTSVFINGTGETAITAIDAHAVDSFFDATDYIGAIKDANDTWYQGWTCNSASADFDDTANTDRSCLSIPTT